MDSRTVINILVEIAELEELRLQAHQTIRRNARREKDLRELQAEYETDAELADSESLRTGRDFRARDREIRQVEVRLAERRDMIVGVTDRRQHRALSEEISALEKKLDRLETEAIAFLEEEDSRVEAAGQARQESTTRAAQTDETLRTMGQESGKMTARVENIDLDLRRLIGMLPGADRRHVELLRRKLDQSVVFLHNGACRGCFHQLPVQEAINVERGRSVVRCPSCMRYIVHHSWK